MRITQAVGPLIGGVSQTPAHMRSPEFAEELVNMLAHPALGMTVRPGTRHIAKIGDSEDGHYTAASVFPFSAGDKRRYFLSVTDGQLRVVEADTGVRRTVVLADGADAYLTGLLDESRPFAAVTTGDTLYLANRTRVVQRSTESEPLRDPEALIAIKAADFGTTYSITLDGQEASYRTPDGTDAEARPLISTDVIAQNLANVLLYQPGRGAFRITRSGSTLHIKRADGGNFTISSGDGLADSGIVVVFGQVSSAVDLPLTGVVDGFTIRVQNDPRSSADDFWLKWLGGVWQECARPGSLVALDASTMPHALTLGGSLHDGLIVPEPPSSPSATDDAGNVIPLDWLHATSGGTLLLVSSRPEWVEAQTTPATGENATVTLRFDANTVSLTASQYATLGIQVRHTDGTYESLGEWNYTHEDLVQSGRVITLTRAWLSGERVRVRLTVTDDAGGTPPTEGAVIGGYFPGTASLTFAPTGPDKGVAAGVSYKPASSSLVLFPPDAAYPATANVTVTADGVTRSITVGDSGATGLEAAAAILAAWPTTGSVLITDGGAGKLVFRNTATGTSPAVSAAVTVDYAHTLWIPDGAYAPGSLVGLRLRNLTTAAEGTITANTARTISFTTMTGGSSDTLRRGDLIQVLAAPDSFAFSPVVWEKRTAGDDDSNPFPSFVGRTVSAMQVAQNRLVLVPGDSVVASGAGKLQRFFRTSTQQVLDNDVIDVRGTGSRGLPFWHAVEWNGGVNLLNGRAIFSLDGEPLTPRTVGLSKVFDISANERCAPVVVGRRLYIARVQNGYTQLIAIEATGQGIGVDSADATAEVPEYLRGEPVAITGEADGPVVLITEDAGTRYLYVTRPVNVGRAVVFAWASWALDASAVPLAVTLDGGDLLFVLQRADGVYLESLDTLAHLT